MKIEGILNYLNSFEKNAFLKVIDSIISNNPKNFKAIDKILSQLDGRLKNADNSSIREVLKLIEPEFGNLIKEEFLNTSSQLDILIDILIRDGNSLMKREWLGRLYENEIKKIKGKLKEFKTLLDQEEKENRLRDYEIYSECLKVAFNNDKERNQESKITRDEHSILLCLSGNLELSHEEIRLINYTILPLKKLDLDETIKYLSSIGVIFYSRKNHQIYVADEILSILRKVRGKEVPDKIFRKILKQLKDAHINQLSRKHNIDRRLSKEEKIKEIIREGISFSGALTNGIFKEDVNKTERKNVINELIEKKLKIDERIKGLTLPAKVKSLIEYLNKKEKEGSISISLSGYDKLIRDLSKSFKGLKKLIKETFELQEEEVLDAKFLLKYNIRPMDILYLLEEQDLKTFCSNNSISLRGSEVLNILSNYKDIENLYIENYANIANRDLNLLTENGLKIPEAELGVKFEEVTKSILTKMGLKVDEDLRSKINTAKDKIDIVVRDQEKEVLIIECKSKKERGYNNYSSVSRQLKAYKNLVEKKGFNVKKMFVFAPSFTDDFVDECGLDYELNLSLLTAETLLDIYEVFQELDTDSFPISLLMRDVLIDRERVLKSLNRIN